MSTLRLAYFYNIFFLRLLYIYNYEIDVIFFEYELIVREQSTSENNDKSIIVYILYDIHILEYAKLLCCALISILCYGRQYQELVL
jgi:hypothetical protein